MKKIFLTGTQMPQPPPSRKTMPPQQPHERLRPRRGEKRRWGGGGGVPGLLAFCQGRPHGRVQGDFCTRQLSLLNVQGLWVVAFLNFRAAWPDAQWRAAQTLARVNIPTGYCDCLPRRASAIRSAHLRSACSTWAPPHTEQTQRDVIPEPADFPVQVKIAELF